MGKVHLLEKLKPYLMLTEIRVISDEQPPSVSYTRGYAELPTILHTFRIDNEASRFTKNRNTVYYSVRQPEGLAKMENGLRQLKGLILSD